VLRTHKTSYYTNQAQRVTNKIGYYTLYMQCCLFSCGKGRDSSWPFSSFDWRQGV
jgi:hypothetical protein